VGAIDHQSQGSTGSGGDTPIQRASGGGSRVAPELDVTELGPEAVNELLPEPLAGLGSVVDCDHLVVEVLDILLVSPR